VAERRNEARINKLVGVFVIAMGSLVLVSLFLIAASEGLLETKTGISSDFRTVTGLSKGSPVQLGGVKIGTVDEINFGTLTYPCAYVTEDLGRDGEGRTDDCDPSLFCGPEGLCAEFDGYTGEPKNYQVCTGEGSCATGELCVTQEFTRRYRRVRWQGPEGFCVPYATQHQRLTVDMLINEDRLINIRTDSRATVAANGVLGDQLVNITVGSDDAEQIQSGGSIQSTPSLMEEINLFRVRLDSMTDKIDRSLAGLAGLFDSLNDDRVKQDLKDIISNTSEISRQIKDGQGVVGALFNDPEMKDEVAQTLRHVRHTASEADQTIASLNKEFGPAMKNISQAANGVSKVLDVINDPTNQSPMAKLVHDDEMGENLNKTIAETAETMTAARGTVTDTQVLVAELRHSIATGEGTLGKLIKDPKAYDDLVKVLGNIERVNLIKKFVRFIAEQDEAASSARPTVAVEPESKDRRTAKGGR
jgi:ABC-type transporter Mla subunit MlaD